MHAGEPIPSPPYPPHSFLAALLLRPRPLRRVRLIGLLYPDLPERAGRRRLSDLLWLLRRSLSDLPLPLHIGPQEVCLPPDACWLDVEAFRQAAGRPDLSDFLAHHDIHARVPREVGGILLSIKQGDRHLSPLL